MSETLRQRFAYHAYASADRIARSLPERLGRRVFLAAAHLHHRFGSKTRATVAANFSRVLGRPADSDVVRSAVREAFELYWRYWLDTFRLRTMTPAEFEKRMEYEGLEHIDRALEAGNGVVTVLPHMGNWDAAGRWLSLNGYRVISVAEAVQPERLLDLFMRHREELGLKILTLEGGGGTGKKLARRLAENWIVALVADRDLSGKGIEVEMFGAERKLPVGPALLSLQSGAALLVCPVYTTDDGWFCRVGAPIEIDRTGEMRKDVGALTRAMGAEFERAIAARPADWHMFQPAWES